MNSKKIIVAAFLFFPAPIGAMAQTTAKDTITVNGLMELRVKPNMAHVVAGVTTEDSSIQRAQQKNSVSMNSLMAALKAEGIPDQDIRTTSFNVSPVYSSTPQGKGQPETPRITGYSVSNNVQVDVLNLQNLGSLLDLLMQQGSNRIEGITFDLRDYSTTELKALAGAVENAKQRAETIATAGGVHLAEIQSITDNTTNLGRTPSPVNFGTMETLMASSPVTPISSGRIHVSADVTVAYYIKRLFPVRSRGESGNHVLSHKK